MSCYESLADFYDRLTEDVDYRRFADRYEQAFSADGGEFHLLLDLCCGTGSLSLEMSGRGYEIIGTDASERMLMHAREKCAGLSVPPLCEAAASCRSVALRSTSLLSGSAAPFPGFAGISDAPSVSGAEALPGSSVPSESSVSSGVPFS